MQWGEQWGEQYPQQHHRRTCPHDRAGFRLFTRKKTAEIYVPAALLLLLFCFVWEICVAPDSQKCHCKWLVLYILRDTYTRPINLFSYDRLLTIIPLVVRVCFQNFHCISNRQRLTHATIIRVIDWLHKLIFIAV